MQVQMHDTAPPRLSSKTHQGHVTAVLEADVGRERRACRVPPAAVLVRAEHIPDELLERAPVPRALQQVAGSVLSSPPLSGLPRNTFSWQGIFLFGTVAAEWAISDM
jgi:hypothetical protein